MISFSYQYESNGLNIEDGFSIQYFLIQFALIWERKMSRQTAFRVLPVIKRKSKT
jgi:hypothetical protein